MHAAIPCLLFTTSACGIASMRGGTYNLGNIIPQLFHQCHQIALKAKFMDNSLCGLSVTGRFHSVTHLTFLLFLYFIIFHIHPNRLFLIGIEGYGGQEVVLLLKEKSATQMSQ
uniref:Uncharacterized protein n=1 Tax=Sphaerodactylus townsendi TaxID=933632 RepID=A0ACB8EIT7_9SAUR